MSPVLSTPFDPKFLASQRSRLEQKLEKLHSRFLKSKFAETQLELSDRVQQVRFALKRLVEREYGICVQCRKPIPKEELQRLPERERCASCSEGKR